MAEYRFGHFRFRDVEVSEDARNDPDYKPQTECLTCKRILLKKTMKSHVEVHDRREAQKKRTEALRYLGFSGKVKVLKGQQGLF